MLQEKARLSEELLIECNKRATVEVELEKLQCVITQLHQKMSQLKVLYICIQIIVRDLFFVLNDLYIFFIICEFNIRYLTIKVK